jgi:hypothetical protein
MAEVVNLAAATEALRKAHRQQAQAPSNSRQHSKRKWLLELFGLTIAIILAFSIPMIIEWLELVDELQWLVR